MLSASVNMRSKYVIKKKVHWNFCVKSQKLTVCNVFLAQAFLLTFLPLCWQHMTSLCTISVGWKENRGKLKY